MINRVTGVTSRMSARRALTHVGLIGFGIFMLYPVLWMISSSFKPGQEIFTEASLWPRNFTIGNYTGGWTALGIPFSVFYVNTAIVVAGSIIGNLISCSLAAYAFARLNFRFKKIWFGLMLLTLMVPHHVLIIPQYIMFSKIDWVNTFYPLIVPKFLATDAFFIFLMTQFIRGLPRELDDSAIIDGCGFFGIYRRIMLPLLTPALATTAIFTFIWTWNDFLTPLIYLNDPQHFTIQLALQSFMDSSGQSSWGALFAMSVLSLGPIFGFFVGAQKYLVRGIATTGFK